MSLSPENFQWSADHDYEETHPHVVGAINALNNDQYPLERWAEYLDSFSTTDELSGLRYSRISTTGGNRESAVAISSPYANGLDTHRLALGAVLHVALEKGGFHDEVGDPLDVITISSPVGGNRVRLDSVDRSDMVEGYAIRQIELLGTIGVSNAALVGFSQGADMSLEMAAQIHEEKEDSRLDKPIVDVAHVAAGDPIRVTNRSRVSLLHDMTDASIKDVKRSMAAGGLEMQLEAYENGGNHFGRFLYASFMPTNMRHMTAALGRDRFDKVTAQALKESSVSIGRGSETLMTPESGILGGVFKIFNHQLQGEDVPGQLRIHEYVGEDHTMGDNATKVTAFYLTDMPKSF